MLNIDVQGQTLVFQGELNRATVPTVQPCKALKGLTGKVEFRLGKLNHVDTAGLAWLLHQIAESRRQQLEIRLTETPAQLRSLAKVSDVLSLLPIES